jgi:hypothetical protein
MNRQRRLFRTVDLVTAPSISSTPTQETPSAWNRHSKQDHLSGPHEAIILIDGNLSAAANQSNRNYLWSKA